MDGDGDGDASTPVQLAAGEPPSLHEHDRVEMDTEESARIVSRLIRHAAIQRYRRAAARRRSMLAPPGTLLSSWTPRDGYSYVNGGDDAYRGGGFGAVPASGEAVAALPETTAMSSREGECAVCLEGYEAGDALRTMPCSHGFHERCIFDWLRVSRLCPLCRFALPADSDTGEEGEGEDDGDEDGDDDRDDPT